MNKKNGKYAAAWGDVDIRGLLLGEQLVVMILVAAAIWLCFRAELVKIEFLVGVLVLIESVASFRIGRWLGKRKNKAA